MGIFSSLFGSGKADDNQQEKQDKKNFEILKYDGIRARNMHQLAYAIKCFEEALNLQEEPEVLQLLAATCVEDGRIEEARVALGRLTALVPDTVQGFLMLAKVCEMQADYESMEAACQKVLQMDAANATAYYLAGKAAYSLKNLLQAIVMLTKATVTNGEYVEAYLLRAEVLWSMRQVKDAMEDVEKVLSMQPEEEDGLLLKAKLEAALGKVEEAYTCIHKVMEVNPFSEKAYLLKVELLVEQNLLAEAETICNDALELMPQNARFYQERGRVCLLKGEKDKSLADMKKAIELNPENEKKIDGSYNNQSVQQPSGIY